MYYNHLKFYDNRTILRYTATPVACGWAGATFEVTRLFGQEQWGQRIKFIKKVKCNWLTDRQTDGRTTTTTTTCEFGRVTGIFIFVFYFFLNLIFVLIMTFFRVIGQLIISESFNERMFYWFLVMCMWLYNLLVCLSVGWLFDLIAPAQMV